MSLSINTVVIGGNLTRDVELKDVGTTKVGSFTVAVNKKFKGQDGQMKERVSFIAITVWGEQAGLCAKFLRKGSQVIVEGELEQETWEDKDSKKKREKTKVRANHVHFVGAPTIRSQEASILAQATGTEAEEWL